MTTKQVEALAQWLLGTDLPKSVPSIPHEALLVSLVVPPWKLTLGRAHCLAVLRVVINMLAFVPCTDMWLCIFCWATSGNNKARQLLLGLWVVCIKVHNAHGWLKDAHYMPIGMGGPCTNVPLQCLGVTWRRWMCLYVSESHMWEHHRNSAEVVFVLLATKHAAMIAQSEPKTKKGVASNS